MGVIFSWSEDQREVVEVSDENDTEELENKHYYRGQACDRCSRLKRKCRGNDNQCEGCLLSGVECTTNRCLKRKRRPKPSKLTPLEIENLRLKMRVEELEKKLRALGDSYLLSPLFRCRTNDDAAESDDSRKNLLCNFCQ